MDYEQENHTRKVRMYNIAVAFNELYDSNYGQIMSTSELRDYIHKKLNTDRSKWIKNKMNGDYKANGDVIGKHGHNLERVMKNQTNYIKFTENNKAIIDKFLTEYEKERNMDITY